MNHLLVQQNDRLRILFESARQPDLGPLKQNGYFCSENGENWPQRIKCWPKSGYLGAKNEGIPGKWPKPREKTHFTLENGHFFAENGSS